MFHFLTSQCLAFRSTATRTRNLGSRSASALLPTIPTPRFHPLAGTQDGSKTHGSNILFPITAPFSPTGDQPAAIQQLVGQIQEGDTYSNLCGVTGSGKTLVLSHVISQTGKPALVLCHNKTLTAQLARELRAFFRESAVELFVSYYQYYRPEFFTPTTGTYRMKKSRIDPHLDILRHRAVRALWTRPDVIVVASVSCIYGMGVPPSDYLVGGWKVNDTVDLHEFTEQLHTLLYSLPREETELERGEYQVLESTPDSSEKNPSTTVITVWPPTEAFPMQLEFRPVSTRKAEKSNEYTISNIRQGTAQGFAPVESIYLFPARQHLSSPSVCRTDAYDMIEAEMHARVAELRKAGD